MRAAQNPIEVVVSIFVAVTLSYFQLVHVLATSDYFEPLSREVTDMAAASALNVDSTNNGGPFDVSRHGAVFTKKAGSEQWVAVGIDDRSQDRSTALYYVIEPFVLADGNAKSSPILSTLGDKLASQLIDSTSSSLDQQIFPLRDAKTGLTGYGFGRIGHNAQAEQWNQRRSVLQKIDDGDFLGHLINESMTVVNRRPDPNAQLLAIFPDADVRDFFAGGDSDEIRTMRWFGYALWALVMRFWALLKRADSADIFVMLSAYLLMHGTFVNLFLSMRRFGSNFWLGASVLTSSICAFLVALTMAYLLGVTVDPICLSEALPFLVITVGFEKPFVLTKAVFAHPAVMPQASTPKEAHPDLLLSALNDSQEAVERHRRDRSASEAMGYVADNNLFSPYYVDPHFSQEESFVRALTARLKSEPTLRWTSPQPVPAKEIVVAAVDSVGMQIVRDYAIEIAVMAIGATSGISGLRQFCQLAALILTFDCAFLFAFYAAVLTIMVEVHRIKVMRGRRRAAPSTPPNVDSDVDPSMVASPPSEALSPSAPDTRDASPEPKNANKKSRSSRPMWRKVVKFVFGKVPFEPTPKGSRENPVARLKLLLVTTFLTLHSLNLVSTLTTQSAVTRHHSTDGPTLYQQIQMTGEALQVDASSPLVAPMLARVGQAVSSADGNSDIYVKVYEPIVFVLSNNIDANTSSQPLSSRTSIGELTYNASNGGIANQDSSSSLSIRLGNSHTGIARSSNAHSGPASLNVLDSFMTGWTTIVGDPVISKWISVALVISIFLNAFLLKGISSGNAAVADGNAAGAAAFAAARMIGAHLNRTEESVPSTASKLVDPKELSKYHRDLAKSAASHTTTTKKRNQGLSETGEKARMPTSGGVAVRKESITPQQTASISINGVSSDQPSEARPLEDIIELYAEGAGVTLLSDEEMILLVQKGKVPGYSLEKVLQDNERAVRIRRATISRASSTQTLEHSLVPLAGYDYAQVMGACCENVVGFMPLPLGIAGPLLVDGQMTPIPMATTEGTLVASTSRGCKALNAAGGVTTVLTQDAMTRGPAVEFTTITQAAKAKRWIDSPDGAATIKEAFDSTSRFARLSSLRCVMAGRTLYVRFATSTGDAMGMNMVSKGVEKALACMGERFEMTILSLSGNYCIDKKPSAINWIEGRGKSVCCEAVIPGKTVKSVLKTSVENLVNLNIKKNLIGSAMAGSIGGFNAHAANIVAAIYLATGQDPAQVVESSMCMTLMEAIPSTKIGVDEPDLLVTVSMPSIEVGTVGGGTILSPQRALLDMLGVAGSSKDIPGANAQRLARIIAAAVMAGELSLMGALSAGHLIQAHMKHNRSVPPTPGNVTPTHSMSMSSGIFGLASIGPNTAGAGGANGSSRPETPARFQSSMTPLIAPRI